MLWVFYSRTQKITATQKLYSKHDQLGKLNSHVLPKHFVSNVYFKGSCPVNVKSVVYYNTTKKINAAEMIYHKHHHRRHSTPRYKLFVII